jgi:hypothetical protein
MIPTLDHVSCGIACIPFCVDAAPLRKSVKEKAAKYRNVVHTLRLPFVVSIIPDFRTGRGLDDLEEAVLGQQRCRLWKGPQGMHRPEYYRDADGLFAQYPELSAVTLGRWNGRKLAHNLLPNPLATHPLGERAFPDAKVGAEQS